MNALKINDDDDDDDDVDIVVNKKLQKIIKPKKKFNIYRKHYYNPEI